MLRRDRASFAGGARAILVGLLALAAALPIDDVVHDLAFRHVVSHEVRLLANGLTHLGTGWAASGLLGALAVAGYRTGDVTLLRASLAGLGGVVLGSAVGQVVKQVACRGRPGLVDGWGVHSVGPSGSRVSAPTEGPGFFHWPCLGNSRYHSFPSGHATVAFAVAAALARAVPDRRRLWLGVASGVGLSRVLLNAHFLSDVLGGALVGWWVGQTTLALADRATAVATGGSVPVEAERHPGALSV